MNDFNLNRKKKWVSRRNPTGHPFHYQPTSWGPAFPSLDPILKYYFSKGGLSSSWTPEWRLRRRVFGAPTFEPPKGASLATRRRIGRSARGWEQSSPPRSNTRIQTWQPELHNPKNQFELPTNKLKKHKNIKIYNIVYT